MKLILGPVIGAVSSDSANVMVRLSEPGLCTVRITGPGGETHDALIQTTDGSLATGCALFSRLGADTAWTVEVFDTNNLPIDGAVASGFRTLPSDPARFAFTFMSCHRPDAFDPAASGTYALWDLLNTLQRNDPEFSRFNMHIGDQIYGDPVYEAAFEAWRRRPVPFSVDIGRIAQEYGDLYQSHWSPNPVRTALANNPNFMIWDDHDIADGWGSRATTGWNIGQSLFQSASIAYRFFQWSHAPRPGQFPGAFVPKPSDPINRGYGFHVGSKVAFLVPDQRSFRQSYDPLAKGQRGCNPILGEQQAHELSDWLTNCSDDLKILFFVATVPFFHLSLNAEHLLGHSGELDVEDSWLFELNIPDLNFILHELLKWKNNGPGPNVRKVVILGGDVHMATASTIEINDQGMVQFVSSPITNTPTPGLVRDVLVAQQGTLYSQAGIGADFSVVGSCPTRNFGRVVVDMAAGNPQVTFEIYAEGNSGRYAAYETVNFNPWLQKLP